MGLATAKVTFTLDDATITRLEDAAEILSKPKSGIVREVIEQFYGRIGRVSERERVRRVRAFEEYMAQVPLRPQEEADREIAEIRRARRSGGRRHPV